MGRYELNVKCRPQEKLRKQKVYAVLVVGAQYSAQSPNMIPRRSRSRPEFTQRVSKMSEVGSRTVPNRSHNKLVLELCDPKGSSEAHGGRRGALRRPVYKFVKTFGLISVPILEPKCMFFLSRPVTVSKVPSRSNFGSPLDSLGSPGHAPEHVNMGGELDVARFEIVAVPGASEVAFWLRWEPLWELF